MTSFNQQPSNRPPDRPPRLPFVAAVFTFGLSVCLIYVGSMIAWREFNHVQRNKLDRAIEFQKRQSYLECMTTANEISSHSIYWSKAQSLADDCRDRFAALRFNSVERSLEAGQLRQAAIALNLLPPGSITLELRQLMETVSDRLLQQAKRDYHQLDCSYLERAVGTLNLVPRLSYLWQEAQSLMQQWQAEFNHSQQALENASAALERNDFRKAQQSLEQINFNHPCWRERANRLQTLVNVQMTFHQANDYLRQCEPQNAIGLANQLPDNVPWQERKANLIKRANRMEWFKDIFGADITCGLLDRLW